MDTLTEDQIVERMHKLARENVSLFTELQEVTKGLWQLVMGEGMPPSLSSSESSPPYPSTAPPP